MFFTFQFQLLLFSVSVSVAVSVKLLKFYSIHPFFCLMLELMFAMHVVLFVHCKLLLHSHCYWYRITSHKTCVMAWNGNTTERKKEVAEFITFRVKIFRLRFISLKVNHTDLRYCSRQWTRSQMPATLVWSWSHSSCMLYSQDNVIGLRLQSASYYEVRSFCFYTSAML